LPSSESIRINNPIASVELHTQDNVAAHGSVFRRQSRRQGTQVHENERDLSGETNREIDELQQNVAYGAMIWGQCQATQQQEASPESLQTNIAYSSTFLRQGDQDIQLQEIEAEYSYVSIN
jgi:predicted carbohydrate-binding protein with CBM5 and CBM33 domain